MDALLTAMTSASANTSPATEGLPVNQTETVTDETKTQNEETPVVESKQEPISPRLSAIIKREGALIKKERELKEREAALSETGKDKLSREELMQSLMEEYEEDPYEFMNKNGFSYEKLQSRILGGDDTIKFNRLEKEINRLNKLLEDKEQKKKTEDEENEDKDYEQKKTNAIDFIKREILKSEDFELIANEGAFDLVYDVIQEHYQETDKILSVSEAANLVEKHLEDDFKKRLEYKKVKKWTSPSESPSQSIPSEQSSPKPIETKTITSDMIPASGTSKSDLEMTDEERMAKAIRIMKGEV